MEDFERFVRARSVAPLRTGPAHTSIWGTSTSAISWRTRELVALTAALLLVPAWRVRLRVIRARAGAGRSGGA